MSDRITGLTVYFKKPVKDEDAVKWCEAIELMSNISKVEMKIVGPDYYFAHETVRRELIEKIWDILK